MQRRLQSGVTIAAITRSVALLRVTKRDVMSASLAAEAADAPIWVPLRGRQVDGERASLVRAWAGCGEAAAVGVDDGPADRQADAWAGAVVRAGEVASVEPLEGVVELLGRHAVTVVADGDADLVAIAGRRNHDGAASRGVA